MAVVDRFKPDDREQVELLYRRVFGADAAHASRLRWEWQYRRNPNSPDGPSIWLAREGPTIIGQYATMPVRLQVGAQEVDGSWGMDVMVAPERQRQGLGEVLFNTWDLHVGASLGLGLSEASYRLFQKLQWPDVGPVPCVVKPLTRRALRRPDWPQSINRVVSALTYPAVKLIARPRPVALPVELTRRFDEAFTRFWERVAPKFDLIVRRDAQYLQWKYASPPHVRYRIAVVRRAGDVAGYVVYRHVQEPRGRVTLVVDLLTDPDDEPAITALLAWVDREALGSDSDKIRAFVLHAGLRRAFRRAGYFQVASTLQLVAKVNALKLPRSFYDNVAKWHVMLGDSDQDR